MLNQVMVIIQKILRKEDKLLEKRKIYPIPEEKIGIIPIGGKNEGKYAIIDLEDINICQKFNWHLDNQGYPKSVTETREHFRLHTYIFKHHELNEEGKDIDHIDGNKLNARKVNLRCIPHKENTWNRKTHSNNTSGFRGVKYSDNHWVARIYVEGKYKHLGYFKFFEEAVEARLKAEKEYFGEYNYKDSDTVSQHKNKTYRRNKGLNNSSGFVGVSKTKEGKWRARITVKGKEYNLGVYTLKEDAIQARLSAEKKWMTEK